MLKSIAFGVSMLAVSVSIGITLHNVFDEPPTKMPSAATTTAPIGATSSTVVPLTSGNSYTCSGSGTGTVCYIPGSTITSGMQNYYDEVEYRQAAQWAVPLEAMQSDEGAEAFRKWANSLEDKKAAAAYIYAVNTAREEVKTEAEAAKRREQFSAKMPRATCQKTDTGIICTTKENAK